MSKRLPARPSPFATHLMLEDFAREAQLSQTTVRRMAEAHLVSRYWCDYRRRNKKREKQPPCWMYFVGDLPDACGSAYLVNFLEARACAIKEDLREVEERLDRVIQRRRIGGAA